MLLNLSNHPSSLWQQNQAEAARLQYGSVVDLPFPAVPPEAATEDIYRLALKYLDRCLEILQNSKDENNAVHVMGEMTLAFTLVAFLQHSGIQCVASTTTRTAVINSNGEKTSQFEFVKFRNYPLLNSHKNNAK